MLLVIFKWKIESLIRVDGVVASNGGGGGGGGMMESLDGALNDINQASETL